MRLCVVCVCVLALAGPLADAFGVSTVLWVSAGVAIVVSLFQLAWRDVRAPHDMGPARGPSAGAPHTPA